MLTSKLFQVFHKMHRSANDNLNINVGNRGGQLAMPVPQTLVFMSVYSFYSISAVFNPPYIHKSIPTEAPTA